MSGDKQIRSIAIVGGGTAGWMAASVLARALPGTRTLITLIESPDIGTVGVGEATIPPITDLLRFLSIDQADFVQHTQATYKLGIKFSDWGKSGDTYWHPFGAFGLPINQRPFYHAWQKAKGDGLAPRFNDFSLCAALGDAGAFRFPDDKPDHPASGLRYALHFDAILVARYLRNYAERLGVTRLERTVVGATQRADGFLDKLQFADGSQLQADLYLDCSGFRGALIEEVLHTGYDDWSALLPCDRAIAFPSAASAPRPPFTHAHALSAGWRWRIPLQQRFGNGYVYSSAHISDTQAHDELTRAVAEPPLAEPRLLRFTTGRRKLYWNKNCVALGLASGFLEPLESTSIHLVMSGVYNLLDHFPDRNFDPGNIASYNAELALESERIRDFIALHYFLTQRDDAPLWQYCRTMSLPGSLAERIELYRRTGRIRRHAGELFTELSWFYIFEGMGMKPESYDPLMDVVGVAQFKEILKSLASATAAAVSNAPRHDSYFPPRPAPATAP